MPLGDVAADGHARERRISSRLHVCTVRRGDPPTADNNAGRKVGTVPVQRPEKEDAMADAALEREAFMLGAGFSRAVSGHMPLTDELGQLLVRGAPDVFAGLPAGRSFEQWLSHRAEPQPYLSAAENLERQAVFARATAEIATQLDAAISKALSEPLQAWLGMLIALWHLGESDVVTFNYDTLVECALEAIAFWDWRRDTIVAWGSLLNYNPTGWAGATLGEFDKSTAPHRTFRLWKLHGSTNWFWTPGDPSGASAVRTPLPGTYGAPKPRDADEAHWRAPGRERLLVPPSSLKSPYYANPVSREVWARGFEGLARSNVVTLIGYSLPPSDLTTAGMLTEAMARGHIREVRVIDLNPEPIADRIRAFAPEHVAVVPFDGGDEPVPAYVHERRYAAAITAVESVQAAPDTGTTGVVVTWGDSQGRQALGRTALALSARREVGSTTVEVQASEPTTFDGAIARWSAGPPERLGLGELRQLSSGAEQICVRLGDDPRSYTVIAATGRRAATGQGDGTWLQLIPAEPPPN